MDLPILLAVFSKQREKSQEISHLWLPMMITYPVSTRNCSSDSSLPLSVALKRWAYSPRTALLSRSSSCIQTARASNKKFRRLISQSNANTGHVPSPARATGCDKSTRWPCVPCQLDITVTCHRLEPGSGFTRIQASEKALTSNDTVMSPCLASFDSQAACIGGTTTEAPADIVYYAVNRTSIEPATLPQAIISAWQRWELISENKARSRELSKKLAKHGGRASGAWVEFTEGI